MERLALIEKITARADRRSGDIESFGLHGRYDFVCHDKNGKEKWRDHIDNVITTVGKNLLLDTILAGSAYTVTGPFLGLISSVDYTSAPVASDTMASHSGWYEVDASTHLPTVAARLTTNGGWASASAGSKALTTALAFYIIAGGTLKGSFLVLGAGAVDTLGSTAGTLLSAGLFVAGDKALDATDTLYVSYTLSANA